LAADLSVPVSPRGIVIFAHGSGSGRHSPRNQAVAEALQSRGLATLLADLLTMEEETVTGSPRAWIDIERSGVASSPRSTGAQTCALTASIGLLSDTAPQLPRRRGGSPARGGCGPRADDRSRRRGAAAVTGRTLLLVGSLDTEVIDPLSGRRLTAWSSVLRQVHATHLV
jgi:hypothetical protein